MQQKHANIWHTHTHKKMPTKCIENQEAKPQKTNEESRFYKSSRKNANKMQSRCKKKWNVSILVFKIHKLHFSCTFLWVVFCIFLEFNLELFGFPRQGLQLAVLLQLLSSATSHTRLGWWAGLDDHCPCHDGYAADRRWPFSWWKGLGIVPFLTQLLGWIMNNHEQSSIS